MFVRFVGLSVRSLVRSFVRSFVPSFVRPFIRSFVRSFSRWFVRSSMHELHVKRRSVVRNGAHATQNVAALASRFQCIGNAGKNKIIEGFTRGVRKTERNAAVNNNNSIPRKLHGFLFRPGREALHAWCCYIWQSEYFPRQSGSTVEPRDMSALQAASCG